MVSDTLYSTIATINGVWITIIFTLGSVLITYILERNTIYFTSMRKELGRLQETYRKLQLVSLWEEHIGKNAFPVEEAKYRLSELLNHVQKECRSRGPTPPFSHFNSVGWTVQELQRAITYYPNPGRADLTFAYNEKLGGFNELYTNWVEAYDTIINYDQLFETFEMLARVVTPRGSVDIPTIDKIENTCKLLNEINGAVRNIHALQTDYAPIIETKRRIGSIGPIFSLIILFGVLLPMYMLIPVQYHIDILPEYIVILLIFVSNSILYVASYRKIGPIVKLVLGTGQQ